MVSSALKGVTPSKMLLIGVAIIVIALIPSVSAQTPSIDVVGVAFGHTEISVNYSPTGIENLDNAVKDAVKVWNEAINQFASKYGYQYLSSISLSLTSGQSDVDISVRYEDEVDGACGRTEISYFVDGRIMHALVRISRECVGADYMIAFTVAAHELGHALGLGHSDFKEDLMYGHYTGLKTPSTLDLYALSIIYDWVKDGVFRRPSSGEVSLPEHISFEYLPAAETSEKVTIRFLMDTGLGLKVLKEERVDVGTVLSYSVDGFKELGNKTRFIFLGWYRGGNLITQDTTIVINATSNADYVAVYRTEYYVSVDLGYEAGGKRFVESWVARGDVFSVGVTQVRELQNRTRYVFDGWEGDLQGEDPIVNIRVYGPIEARAVWKTQYYVEVISEFIPINGSGWYDVGASVEVIAPKSQIFLREGESKALLKGFSIDYLSPEYGDFYTNGTEAEVIVYSPITITALWDVFHHVLITSTHAEPVIFDGWVEDGEVFEIYVDEEFVWSNLTKAVFKGWVGDFISGEPGIKIIVKKPLKIEAEWRIYYWVEIESDYEVEGGLVGWVERGSKVYVNASPTTRVIGDGVRVVFDGWEGSWITGEPAVLVEELEAPLVLRALWRRQYLVTVSAPSVAGGVVEEWVDSGSPFDVEVPAIIPLNDNARLSFRGWVGCPSKDTVCRIQRVEGSMRLKARYLVEWLLTVKARSYDGEEISDANIVLKSEGNAVETKAGAKAWLQEGDWVVERAVWKGYDVTSSEVLRVDREVGMSGVLYVPVRVFRASFRVTDFIGFPVKGAEIVVRGPDGALLYRGEVGENGEVWEVGPLPPSNLKVEAAYLGFRAQKAFDISNPRPIQITLPISMNTIYGIAGLTALITSIAAISVIRGRRKPPEPYYEEPPIAYPSYRPEYPPAEEEAVREAEKVVTIDEVMKSLEGEEELLEAVKKAKEERIPEKKVERRIKIKRRKKSKEGSRPPSKQG